jgi:hypothetical protein
MLRPATTSICNCSVAVAPSVADEASRTQTVIVKDPALRALPERSPLDERVKPPGSGVAADHLYGGVPPDARSCAFTEEFTFVVIGPCVTIVSGLRMVNVKRADAVWLF